MTELSEIDGIPIDPELPEGFDDTPNGQRPDSHQVWWYRPFIVTDRREPETYEQYVERLEELGYDPDLSREDWLEQDRMIEKSWREKWPEGVRYNVRCLDGGAWDRSTNHGLFPRIDKAVAVAKGLSTSKTEN